MQYQNNDVTFFLLNKSTPIIIYGMANTGIELYRNLNKEGFSIEGFIDRKGKNISTIKIDDKYVPVFESINKKDEKNGSVIIISIRNAIEQNKVAGILHKNGYENIIFLPTMLAKEENSHLIDKMREVYRNIDRGIFLEYGNEIPCYSSMKASPGKTTGIIKSFNEYCIVNVPLSLVYMESLKFYQELIDVYGLKCIPEYYDKNIVATRPLIELFKFFEDGEGDINLYIDKFTKDGNSIPKNSTHYCQVWLDDRKECFNLLSSGLQTDQDFFIKSAIPAKWNKKGYFNVIDGKHRAVFLYFKGFNMIPLEISKDDYNDWLNKTWGEKCREYINMNKFTDFIYPIEHPYFTDFDCIRKNYGKSILATLQEYLGIVDIRKLKVIDINAGTGYFAQHFSRYGANVTAIEPDKKKYEFACLLNGLFYQEQIDMYNFDFIKWNKKAEFDIVLAFDILGRRTNDSKKQVLKKINDISSGIMFWESDADIEEEKRFIINNSDFNYYKKLRNTFKNKQICELGIFSKKQCFDFKKFVEGI